jgi:N-hydroxyarylamine O-acetyltransferase
VRKPETTKHTDRTKISHLKTPALIEGLVTADAYKYNSLYKRQTMSANFDRKKYLQRIGFYQETLAPDVETLKNLQRKHLLAVPFENLDIHWKHQIVLDTGAFYRKIVEENRGGFCYELNGLFNELLRDLGYKTKMVSARVGGEGKFGREFDHMAIIAEVGGEEYLADVGFGDFIAEPLKVTLNVEQQDATGVYRIGKLRFEGQEYLYTEKKNGDAWKGENIWTLTPRALSDYAEMCRFQQTSPESHFTQNKVCSLMTDLGRKTLSSDKFIETEDGVRTETPVENEEQFNEILLREFGIEANPKYDRLHFIQ